MFTYDHMSDIGGCLTRLVAIRQGYEPLSPPPKTQELYNKGHMWEDIIIDYLLGRGHAIYQRQYHTGLYLVKPDVTITCHLDGFCDDGMRSRVLEIKSMSHDIYQQYVEKGWDFLNDYFLGQKYKVQVSGYMLAVDEELMFVGVDRDSSPADPNYNILYKEEPFYNLEWFQARLGLVEKLADDRPFLPSCESPSYFCPWWYVTDCWKKTDYDESNELLEGLALEIVQAQDDQEKAKKKLSDLRKAAFEAMGEKVKVQTEAATLSINKGRTSKYLDEEAMTKDGIDVQKYKKEKRGESYITARRTKDVKLESL